MKERNYLEDPFVDGRPL